VAVAEETLLQQLIRVEPQLKPPQHYPNMRALEAFLEGELRHLLEERGLGYSVALLPGGRYLAQVVDDRSRHEATGFSAWKALAKAYLRWRGLS